jgi:O-antigen/teichoic acid export membrane protein
LTQPADAAKPASPPPPAGTMGRRAARGTIWALVGQVGGQALRLGGNVILTRMLPKEAFGVMLLVNTVMQGINLFSDLGIGPAIIQNKRDDAKFLNTAYTMQAARGLGLTLFALAVAWPVAAAYDEPVLVGLVAFVGTTGLVNGLRSTNVFTANRALSIGRLTGLELASRAIGLVATLAWALIDPSVWAMAFGGVAAAVTTTWLSHAMLPGIRNRLEWDRPAAATLFKFGKWIFVSTLLGYLAMQSDRLVFGKLISMDELGVYAIATLIATAPQGALRHMALTVNFPLYSQTVRDEGDLPTVFRRGRTSLLLLGGFVCAGMIAAGPTAIDILYEQEYAEAGWMVQLLGAATWFCVLEVTIEAALLARGQTRSIALLNAGKIVVMLALIPIGYVVAGFPGAVAGFCLAEVFRYLFAMAAIRPARLRGLAQEAGTTALVLASGALGLAAVWGLRSVSAPLAVEALAVATVVGLVWGPVALVVRRRRAGRVVLPSRR